MLKGCNIKFLQIFLTLFIFVQLGYSQKYISLGTNKVGVALGSPAEYYGIRLNVFELKKCHDLDLYGLNLSLLTRMDNLYGLSFSLKTNQDSVYGLSCSVIQKCDELYGMQIGFWNRILYKQYGLQVGIINLNGNIGEFCKCPGTVKGVQLGLYNFTRTNYGLQIGLINNSDRGKGIQIGLLNRRGNNPKLLKWLPLINLKFNKEEEFESPYKIIKKL
jgi:hypothetical protein